MLELKTSWWILLISGSFLGCTSGQGCPYGWVDYDSSDSCYFLSNPTLGYNYGKALSKCHSHQAVLAQIDSQEEFDWLKKQGKTFGSDPRTKNAVWWVGLKGRVDQYTYADGETPVESFLTQWITVPTNSTRKQCGLITWNGTLTMTPDCYTKWTSYVCERTKNISLTCDVDNQWMYSNGACYKMFTPQRSWDDARRFCKDQDSDLAKVTDREALALMWDLAQVNGNGSSHWIGLRADGSQYLWTDNSVLESTAFWDKDEPKSLGSKRTPMCVAINGGLSRRLASWVTTPCSEHASFACSKMPGVCPDGWLQHQSSCLLYDISISLTWMAAKAYCRYLGGDLAMVKSASDQAFLAAYVDRIKDAGLSSIWVGLSDENSNSSWIWSDGVTLNSSLSEWGKAPKNAPGKRDCVYMNTASAKWRTTPICAQDKPFVCELPAGKTVKPFPSIPAADQCEKGWEAAGSFCLQFRDDSSTWYQAMTQCQSDGAELLMVDSDYVQAYLEGNLFLGQTFWLGLSDREEENSFVWVNGSKVTTTHWAEGEPQVDSDKNCVIIQSEGKTVSWKLESCQSSYQFVCSKKAAKTRKRRMSAATTTAAPFDEVCGKEWELRQGTNFCYQFRDTKLSWVDALDVCSHHNGSLVSIASRDEQSYIEGRLKGLSSVAVWIGASDRETEAGWAWEDGAPFGFLHWFPGEPNNMGSNEDCAAINTASMAWYDYPCKTRAGFVCKKQANNAPTTVTPVTTPSSIPVGKFYGCSPGWMSYMDSCLLMKKTEVSWMDAQTACRKEGADLASIGSVPENQVIFSFLPKVRCQNAHSNDTVCKAWADLGECQKNPVWMSRNCKSACNFCQQTCSDVHTQNECHFWASIGECSKNEKWMTENCALSCGCDSSVNFGFWIGLNDRQSQMSFVWSDLSPLTFTNWAKNEPNNHNGKKEDCVKMYSLTGEWGDEICDESNAGYVCKKKKEVLGRATVSPNNAGCPIGAFGYGAKCYMIVDLPLTWQDARRYCQQRHAELATVTNSITGAFITSELIGKTLSYWLGLRSVGTTYTWSSGSKVTYTPWAPTHTGNEQNTCVAVRSQRPVGLWEDADCQKQQPFICEILRRGYTTATTTTTIETGSSTTAPSTTALSCWDGWKAFQNRCYKLHTDIKTWSEGQAICQSYGGSLASVHDDATQNFLSGQLTYAFTPESMWIGLSDRSRESSYTWTDGSPFDYTKWGKDEPNNAYGVEDCVQLYRSGNSWNDNSCFTSAAFVCSVPRGFPTPVMPQVTISTVPPPSCAEDGWVYHKGYCIFISPAYGTDSKLTWFQASRKCLSYGGHLVSIASNADNDFILSMISKQSSGKFWIGLNELGQKSYQWTDGSPPVFLAWSRNEPNDAWGGQKCVNMYTSTGRWNDDNCMDLNGYICKKQNGSNVPQLPIPTPILKTPCPPGFQSSGLTNKCFFLGGLGSLNGDSDTDAPLNWTSARTKCRQLKSSQPVDIASITSRLDQEFITLLIRDVKRSVWIGLTDQQQHGTFKWQDNSEVTLTNWGEGEPNDHWSVAGQRDCVEVATDSTVNPKGVGKWRVEVCQKKSAYLCHTFKDSTAVQSTTPSTVMTTKSGSGQCPSSYFEYNNVCFNVVSQLKTWQEARQSCQFFGGDLASTLDVFEMARLDLEIYNSHLVQQAWIGLFYDTASSSYQWSDDWPLDMTFWSKSDPDRQTNNSCVALSAGDWNDTDCTLRLPFACAVRKGGPPTPSPTPTGHCRQQGRVLSGDFCYLARLTHKVSWPEAVYACGELGMELVSVHSLQESKFLYQLVKSQLQQQQQQSAGGYWNSGRYSSSSFWIGLTRDENDGFRWSDRSNVNFFNWGEGEPSSKVSTLSSNTSTVRYDEACVEINTESARWSDVDCLDKNQGYICKVRKVMPPTSATTLLPPKSTSEAPVSLPQTEGHRFDGHSTLKEADSGLTAGQVAGIVLGAICFFIVVAIVLFLARQRFQLAKFKSWAFGNDSGFDNALYKHHAGNKGDQSVEDNGLDQMTPDNSITLGGTIR